MTQIFENWPADFERESQTLRPLPLRSRFPRTLGKGVWFSFCAMEYETEKVHPCCLIQSAEIATAERLSAQKKIIMYIFQYDKE
jgi:hypothetical protein